VVLVFGDSLSEGYGIRQSEAWPSLLQTRLGDRCRVVNASVSGETTAGGRTRFPAALRKHQPSAVVLQLGANDALRGLPFGVAEKNLAAMIEEAQGAGAQVLLVGIGLPPNFGEQYTTDFRELFPRLAKRFHLPPPPVLLAGLEDRRDLFQPDQLHPTAAAQPRILDNVYPSIEPLTR
jgi:acyl-CoA thioesterase-1